MKKSNKLTCCIRTKQRPKTNTYKLFENAGFDVYHFMEPQDIDKYDVPNKISVLENDKGLGFANNFILKWAKEKDLVWIVMADDDINAFGNVVNKKCVNIGAEIIIEMINKAEKLPFEIVGMNSRQFAWSEKKAYCINKKPVGGVVLLNISKINWEYYPLMKQDRDFCMQSIEKGNGVLKFNHLWYNTVSIGSNKGGCFEQYQNNEHETACKILVNRWKGFAKIKIFGGKKDVKFDMEGFAKKFKKIVK